MERLTIKQLCEGIVKARKTASALLDDAYLLKEHGRYARSFALAYAAAEELGKVPLLFGAATRLQLGMRVDWKRVRTSYRNHDYKARNLAFSDAYRLVAEDKGRLLTMQEAAALVAAVASSAKDLPEARMRALYSGFEGGKFIDPSEAITADHADFMIAVAADELADHKSLGGDTAEELAASFGNVELLAKLREVYQHPNSIRD